MTKRKKRAKRGRPRLKRRLREANGRILRTKTPRKSMDKLAIEMRAKRFGLTIEEAKNPLSSTYVGRLYLKGELTQDQYDAAQKYLQIKNDYWCAKGLPSAVYDESPIISDNGAREKWVQMATEHFSAVQNVVQEAQCLYHQYNLHAALQYLVIEDQSLPQLVCSLRIVLNALYKHFTQNR
ncbi:hypothetical protein [Bartonella sp. AR 15-3]|uniref:hypothetical protein n=1 Tax=Bartonella sp. AR 15-3 TaxID=545617 RepID=UPI0001F4BCD4|nr:hypothetical protein [Bartonella sp. AR 15-3]OPB31413.1 hypothetical protein BAR153v2_003550 [Bartonella sp. AR 15-3]CBI78667.1 conserved hypothetical protein [Bartonella sp. AR 15-3]